MGILLGCFGSKRGPLCFCLFGWCLPLGNKALIPGGIFFFLFIAENPLGNKALTPVFVALPQLHPTLPLASLSDLYMLKDLNLHAK
jgi:hypothetical protein